MKVQFINQFDKVTKELSEVELTNIIRKDFSKYISINSFRMELDSGKKEWNSFDYNSHTTIKIL
jgi:hypothetical protein